MERQYIIGGNWKCNGSKGFIQQLIDETLNKISFSKDKVQVIVAPPSLYIEHTKSLLQSDISIAAQNISSTGAGAYTGEIAAEQLLDCGIQWAIVGHSERRSYYAETEILAAKKTKRAISLGMNVIFCIGESLEDRQGNKTMDVLIRQTQPLIDLCHEESEWNQIVVAYEPVWAIGTGVVATQSQAQETHKAYRQWIGENLSPSIALKLRIIYGGSVNGKNCAELIASEDVDGFLVGGASLKPEFSTIVASAM